MPDINLGGTFLTVFCCQLPAVVKMGKNFKKMPRLKTANY